MLQSLAVQSLRWELQLIRDGKRLSEYLYGGNINFLDDQDWICNRKVKSEQKKDPTVCVDLLAVFVDKV